jgi:hypothetical protein
MTTNTPQQPGRETSGHTGAGLIGSLDTGLEAGPEGQAAKDRARERARREDDAGDGGDATFAGGPGTTPPRGVSRIGSGTTGLNNYSPGSDLSAGPDSPMNRGQLAGAGGGERASAGINDADRSSGDHGNSLDR